MAISQSEHDKFPSGGIMFAVCTVEVHVFHFLQYLLREINQKAFLKSHEAFNARKTY